MARAAASWMTAITRTSAAVALGGSIAFATLAGCLSSNAPPAASEDAAPPPAEDSAPPSSEDAAPLPVVDASPIVDAAGADAADANPLPPSDAGSDAADANTTSPCANNGGCPAHSVCAFDAGIVCVCDPGYAGATCASDCATANGGCDLNATCANGDAGVVCTCNAGFSGTGVSCASNDYTAWPAPSDTPAETKYAVSADGTVVTDLVTALVWQRQIFASPCPLDGAGVCTWSDAQGYCASLNTSALGGIASGWRLPSLVELFSIVNYGDGSPTLDTAIFPATPTTVFWANTPNASNAAQAWSVSFASGLNATQATTTASNVRCVTSVSLPATTPTCGLVGDACCYANSCGPDLACATATCAVDGNYAQSLVPADSPAEPSSTVSADGSLVQDGVTGLFWQRQLAANPCGDGAGVCTWAHATAYCESLSALAVGGVTSGWRLPSVVELLSITNYAAGAPTLDTALFPGTPNTVFWAQTPNASNATQAWDVDFNSGLNALQVTTNASAVRCVSSDAPSASPACGLAGEACCYANACGSNLACKAATTCAVDGNYAQTVVPTDAPPETTYTVSPGGSTVTDTSTGLVWQRQIAANPCPSDAGTGCTWAGAASACDAMNAFAVGGLNAGWRLPTVVELLSLANYAATPTIDPAPFMNPGPATFWSSTANAGTTGQAWTMSYANGLNASQPTASTFDVRCVNASGATPAAEGCGALGQGCCFANSCGALLHCTGGTCVTNTDYALWTAPSDAPSQYTISGDTLTATDTVTGLVWSRGVGAASTWANANAFCASLDASSLGGFNAGWRQPSLVELVSIVSYAAASGPKLDTAVFPNVSATPYWSSTLAASGAASAWSVDFSSGLNSLVSTSTATGVVCVHGG